MLNLMRADMYRLLRGKGIYITLAVMIGIAVLTVFVFRSAMQVGVVGEPPNLEGEYYSPFRQQEVITGADAARMAVSSMEVLMYIFLPLIIMVAMTPFSSSAVKNELTIGFSRMKYYFSKLVLSSILSVAFMIINVLVFVIFGTVRDGFGYWGSGFGLEMLQIIAAQVLFALAFNGVGLFLCFSIRKAGATEGIYIAFTLVPQIAAALLSIAFLWASRILYFDLASLFSMFANIAHLTTTEIVRGLLVGLGWLIVPTVAGLAIFQRADIR